MSEVVATNSKGRPMTENEASILIQKAAAALVAEPNPEDDLSDMRINYMIEDLLEAADILRDAGSNETS